MENLEWDEGQEAKKEKLNIKNYNAIFNSSKTAKFVEKNEKLLK